MQLIYTDAAHTTIQATLDAGETLGNFSGPAVIFVPTDPANAEYAAILASGTPIAPYVAPAASPAAAVAASSSSLQLADAQSLNAQGRTSDAVAAILTIMEHPT